MFAITMAVSGTMPPGTTPGLGAVKLKPCMPEMWIAPLWLTMAVEKGKGSVGQLDGWIGVFAATSAAISDRIIIRRAAMFASGALVGKRKRSMLSIQLLPLFSLSHFLG